MRALLQRVARAEVTSEGATLGSIGRGWAVLLGVAPGDSPDVSRKLAERVAHLRCFEDSDGKMNLSALDIGAELLVVSQFTLYADLSRGRRPSFLRAAPPAVAEPLVTHFADALRSLGLIVATGRFGADMLLTIENDGPVTIWLDTDEQPAK